MRARELAKSCDFTLLRAGVTSDDLAAHCAAAARLHVASVIVPPSMVRSAAETLKGGDVKVGTVVSYPFGTDETASKVAVTRAAITAGARELDVVMNVSALLSGRPGMARADLGAVVDAARDSTSAHVMVRAVVEAPLLGERLLRRACQVASIAGADFVVTATGLSGAARPQDVEVMRNCLAADVGVVAAGGVDTVEQAIMLLDAGAQRVATASAANMVDALMGVAA
ncbi:MAG: deoxyribose-phosphate aldolase [Acidobacteria bacterium]|nr:deoxyribose-phosphate aldolase [Acidobacteriota bacterium]